MVQFPYLDELLHGTAPPPLPAGVLVRHRPLISITVIGPAGQRKFSRALVDSGADDTVFPLDAMKLIGAVPRPDTGHRMRWRGQLHPLLFADVTMVLDDGVTSFRWQAVVAFSSAPLKYPILGNAGCLQFFDVRLLGADLMIELEANWQFPGTRQ